ncbi:MAG: ATP-dependent Clp protease ATP-binding subunit [Lachnospiraceae bacterium]|nr:ATP-dependent Clp protease ATP-binding subunit [Lachnospiraceae bacterium]
MDNYTKSAKQAIEQAKKIAKKLEHGYVGSEHILAGLTAVKDSTAAIVLEHFKVNLDKIIELIEQFISPGSSVVLGEPDDFSPKAKKIMENSELEAKRFKSDKVGTEHILIALLKEHECSAPRLLNTIGVNVQKMYSELMAAMGEDPASHKEDLSGGKKNSKKTMLEQFCSDMTLKAEENKLDPVIGREDEIQRIIQILCRRNKNNPCLVGEPGVGKTAIVEALAMRIVSGNVPENLKDIRIYTLDLSAMVAGSKYRGEFEERIKKMLSEVIAMGNIVLFIDEIHTIIGAGGAEGAIDAANILKPSLARGEIRIIGATTISEYRKHFEKDAALVRRFQPVNVEEPSVAETIKIVNGLKKRYEEHHNVIITDECINEAVKMAERYINDRRFPDKAIDLIDEAASRVSLDSFSKPKEIEEILEKLDRLQEEKDNLLIKNKLSEISAIRKEETELKDKLEKIQDKWEKKQKNSKCYVDENHIAQVVSLWTKIPVNKLGEAESERLLKLESILHERVVGQKEAVTAISKAIRRGRVGLKDPKRPTGSFMFLGPTGVGKTELAKAVAEAVFGSEKSIIRVDMSEYMEKHSVSKLIGSPPGYVGFDDGGQLSEQVRTNPYSVILFDEIEKAHPDVFNVLLQVLDDGHITDSKGRFVDFKNTIIIMTSNAGAERIMDQKKLGFATNENEKSDHEAMKKNVMEVVKKMFKPEFINRIDDIVVFHSLTKTDMVEIIDIMLKDIERRLQENMNITLNVMPKAKEFIVDKSYDKKYGARPLRRALQSNIEDKLSDEILAGNVKNGDKVKVSVVKDALQIKVVK